MLDVPKKPFNIWSDACVVGAGFVDYRKFKPLRLGLFRMGHSYMHPIRYAISIGIKRSFYPKAVSDPFGRILKGRDNLCFAIFEERLCFFGCLCIDVDDWCQQEQAP